MLHALSTPQHTHDPRGYADNFLTLTVPTPQRNQVIPELLYQGRQPGIYGVVETVGGDAGRVCVVRRIPCERNTLRQHVGYEGRRRELPVFLPCD